ncbi:MAG: hypothetical protein ACTSRS_03445 [Candidatus Helarchaeota archaeon]
MNPKEQIVEKLHQIIVKFEETAEITDYAILFDKRVVLAPNTRFLTKEKVEEVLNSIDMESLENTFNRGKLRIVQVDLEKETIIYIRINQSTHLISLIREIPMNIARERLIQFADEIETTLRIANKTTTPDELDVKIEETLTTLESLAAEFKVPHFETFKKLVKFSMPFKKK